LINNVNLFGEFLKKDGYILNGFHFQLGSGHLAYR